MHVQRHQSRVDVTKIIGLLATVAEGHALHSSQHLALTHYKPASITPHLRLARPQFLFEDRFRDHAVHAFFAIDQLGDSEVGGDA